MDRDTLEMVENMRRLTKVFKDLDTDETGTAKYSKDYWQKVKTDWQFFSEDLRKTEEYCERKRTLRKILGLEPFHLQTTFVYVPRRTDTEVNRITYVWDYIDSHPRFVSKTTDSKN